jgi:hypothetical protein
MSSIKWRSDGEVLTIYFTEAKILDELRETQTPTVRRNDSTRL